ncbi:response regulator [Paraflavitalea soli]|uniref:Response regulator n=1 Tax=Paraflavitalea soli TaxID=2315862 RepID=A0A3B7MTJ4_9BACT|nr:response regulator [Paraflavitalea soli]AXY76380.1 response regulator [Paraflavitalea soli]
MTAPNNHDGEKRRILVAEDVEMNQHLARHMIESWGFEVDIAGNGREALVLVQQNHYDLVLMDIHMPEMDGLEATQQIRLLTDPLKASIPIVALTANALKGDRERFLAAGMNDYLPKPINEPHLHRIITDNLTNLTNMITTDQDQRQHILPSKTDDADKLYNLSLVYGIAGGDESFVKRMLQLFLDTMPLTLQEMQKETTLQNWAQVGKLAHKLKSTIDSMGISTLKDTIRQIEQNGKKGEGTEQLPAQVNLVESILQSCAVQVKKDFSL